MRPKEARSLFHCHSVNVSMLSSNEVTGRALILVPFQTVSPGFSLLNLSSTNCLGANLIFKTSIYANQSKVLIYIYIYSDTIFTYLDRSASEQSSI